MRKAERGKRREGRGKDEDEKRGGPIFGSTATGGTEPQVSRQRLPQEEAGFSLARARPISRPRALGVATGRAGQTRAKRAPEPTTLPRPLNLQS